MLYRKQYVKTLRQSGKRVFDCLVDTEQDLQELAQAGYDRYVTIEICQKAYWLEAHRYSREAWELIRDAFA